MEGMGGTITLKGGNKNVIEVKNSNSKYFDRAILFLKEVQLPEPV